MAKRKQTSASEQRASAVTQKKTAWSKGLFWKVPPASAPIPPEGLMRPHEKREPVPWPLAQPLGDIAKGLVADMNLPPRYGGRFSPALRWAITQYAEQGILPPLATWPDSYKKEGIAALDGHRFQLTDDGALTFGYYGPGLRGRDHLKDDAYWWLALGVLTIRYRIRRCPACKRYFADPHHRGKKVCSLKCGSAIRQRTHARLGEAQKISRVSEAAGQVCARLPREEAGRGKARTPQASQDHQTLLAPSDPPPQ